MTHNAYGQYGGSNGLAGPDDSWYDWAASWYNTGSTAVTAMQNVPGVLVDRGQQAVQQGQQAAQQAVTDATTQAIKAATDTLAEGYRIYQDAQDYMTTPQSETLLGLSTAAHAQISALRGKRILFTMANETHGVMAEAPRGETTGAAAYYRLAYWLAVAGRVALGDDRVQEAATLLDAADAQYSRGASLGAAAWGSSLTGVGQGGLWRAGWATAASAWLLWRLGMAEERAVLMRANAPALRAFYARAAIAGGLLVAATAVSGYAVTRGGRVRRNGSKLTKRQRDRRIKGLAMLAAGVTLASPLDESILAVLTVGLGLPIVPIQGGTTLVGGLILAGVGGYTALTPRKATR